jgi:hypothetical protein
LGQSHKKHIKAIYEAHFSINQLLGDEIIYKQINLKKKDSKMTESTNVSPKPGHETEITL